VIGVLKAAFVQGRLTKDELDSRVSQTLAARTYGELAGLTADLPAGLIAAQPARMPARARTRPPAGKVVAGIVLVIPPPVMVLATFLTFRAGSESLMPACALFLVIYFMVWAVAGAQMLANWHDKRSRGQLPQGPAPGLGGQASSRPAISRSGWAASVGRSRPAACSRSCTDPPPAPAVARLAGAGFPVPCSVAEEPVMAEPPDQTPAAAGRGHLRASHTDREQVIGVLKAAFVQGRLDRDEFDLRVGQAFASRTYAELAAVTADLPAGLAAAQPPPSTWTPGEPRIPRPGLVLTVATVLYAGVWVYAILFPGGANSDANGQRIIIGGLFYLLLLLMIGTPILADRLNERFARQLPRAPRPGAGGQAPPPMSSSDPGGQLPQAGHGHQHTAEAARRRRPRPPPLLGSLPPRRWHPRGTHYGDGHVIHLSS
jgi:Domain of unknown function (DUF1707)